MTLRVAGALLLVVMAIHVAVRPEQGWILLSGCDVATVVTAVGLMAGWYRTVAISGLFQAMIGIPAFAVGVFTTYDINPTGIMIHVAPPLLAAIVVARHGMPRRAAAIAWCSYLVVFVAGFVFAPPALNVNFAAFVWPPLANVFTTTIVFQLALLALVALLLAIGEIIALRLVDRARGSAPARS